MKIGSLSFENNVFLAPMAGFTDISFRGLCKEMGCSLVYSEMVSARALYYGSQNTESMLQVSEEEKPIALQIFGNDPYIMAKVTETFNDNKDICIIDVNMGCPAPKIVKNGEGSALMKNPELAASIVKEMKKASSKPITVKFRKGFSREEVTAIEFAQRLEEAGVDAVTVHGRTREQFYEGNADWDAISKVKAAVNIPVIGNGDIKSWQDAKERLQNSSCDGLMIGRGSLGNPWIFRQINSALKGEDIKELEQDEVIDMCMRQYRLAIKYHGEYRAVREMRKQIAWYIKGLPNCTELKNNINLETDSQKVLDTLEAYKKMLTK